MNQYKYTHRYAWAFCLSCASVLAWVFPPLTGTSHASVLPMAPIGADDDDDDRRDSSDNGGHIRSVVNYNNDPAANRFLEPFRLIANALGVSSEINDMSFDLGLVFEDETYNPLFFPEVGTSYNAEIWGVPVQIDVFNVVNERPYFEWVRRTTDDPEVLTFYQELEETPVSFYQLDCWVRTFWGQEFFLSAHSVIPDQTQVPIWLATDLENRIQFKTTWPDFVLLPEDIDIPATTSSCTPTTAYDYIAAVSNPDSQEDLEECLEEETEATGDGDGDEPCVSICLHCPPGSVEHSFCPGCLPPNNQYVQAIKARLQILRDRMDVLDEQQWNCRLEYLKVHLPLLKMCGLGYIFSIPKQVPGQGLRFPPIHIILGCLGAAGIVELAFLQDCFLGDLEWRVVTLQNYYRGVQFVKRSYCNGWPI